MTRRKSIFLIVFVLTFTSLLNGRSSAQFIVSKPIDASQFQAFVASDSPSNFTRSESNAVPQPDRHALRGQYLARTALAYRGAPYRWGGRSLAGFDCSGLAQTVFGKNGITLPRSANEQYQMGKPVSKSELLPGDLVFFKNTYRAGLSHVGIYVGDGMFIHSSRPGVGVVLSSLNEGYHRNHWAGARRIDTALSHR